MNNVYVGTSGFSYKEWKGPFYPSDLKEADFLSFYSRSLNAVEINNSFYRLPKRDLLEKWFDATPAHFRFIIKASRRITHFKRLKDTDEPLGFLIENTAVLAEKLGGILFQLPPNFRCSLDRLKKFVDLLPESAPAAMEFRHESWWDDDVFDVLRSKNVALCLADADDKDLLGGNLPATADWAYLRLRKSGYEKSELKGWSDYLVTNGFNNSFVFFKHEDEGAGPKMAADFGKAIARRRGIAVA